MTIAYARQYLVDTLKEAAGDMPVVLEGENFQPEGTQDYPYARFAFLPVESTNRGLSTDLNDKGLAVIDLCFARNANTVTDALVLAQMVRAVFPVQNVVLESGAQFILDKTWLEAVRHDDDGFFIPLRIRWQYFA